MDVKRDILWRVYLSYILVVVVCLFILGKAFYIQQVEGKYWRSLSDSLHQRIVEIPAARGTIYSEDGQMLSTNMPRFDIYIDFRVEPLHEKSGKIFRENIDSLSISLATLFKDKTAEGYKNELTKAFEASEGNYELRKKIDYREYLTLIKFPMFRLGRYKSGLIAQEKNFRLNPYENIGYRTIGLARDENKVGLEKSYDTVLNGRNGRQLVRAIAGGVTVPVEEGQFEIEPETGKDIVSTIDVFIQEVTENALMKMMIKNEATSGVAMVMEVKTGKIKAIANLGKISEGVYREDLNYAMTPTEPGSTFKLVTLLSALEDGKVTLNSRVNLEGGTWNVAGQTVYDSEKHGKFDASVLEAFEESSNVGMAKIAMANYTNNVDVYFKHLTKLRLDSTSGIDLVGEKQPRIVKPGNKIWGPTTLPWMAFGYNIEIAPIQTLNLYNAIANNGVMMKPLFVKAVGSGNQMVETFEPTVYRNQIASEKTIKQLQSLLLGVVENGTAKNIKNDNYKIAGKTGTAQKLVNGKYTETYYTSFAGYFPADRPKYSMIVVIDSPTGLAAYGGDVSAPVFKEIADRIYALDMELNPVDQTKIFTAENLTSKLPEVGTGKGEDLQGIFEHLGISAKTPSAEDWISVAVSEDKINLKINDTEKPVVPDVSGMPLRDALFILENKGIKVNYNGRGRVIEQSIIPGTQLTPNTTINLVLG